MKSSTLWQLGGGIQPTVEDRATLPQQILTNGRDIILKLEQGEISSAATRVTSADTERFQRFAKIVETKLQKASQTALGATETELAAAFE